MHIAIIGSGFIGGILGGALARSDHDVTFGARDPGHPAPLTTTVVSLPPSAAIVPIADALAGADVVILAVPGAAVAELSAAHGDALAGRLVIDATNQMGRPVPNSRAALPATVRYARAFNTLGGENMAEPVFADGVADQFFSAPAGDRATVEAVIEGVGLRPVYVGEDREALIDALFELWIALAIQQGRGRRLALRLLEG
jgi:predicted dinucleotide-binding enzyme